MTGYVTHPSGNEPFLRSQSLAKKFVADWQTKYSDATIHDVTIEFIIDHGYMVNFAYEKPGDGDA